MDSKPFTPTADTVSTVLIFEIAPSFIAYSLIILLYGLFYNTCTALKNLVPNLQKSAFSYHIGVISENNCIFKAFFSANK